MRSEGYPAGERLERRRNKSMEVWYIDQRSWTFSRKKWEALRVLTEATHLDFRLRKISLGGNRWRQWERRCLEIKETSSETSQYSG